MAKEWRESFCGLCGRTMGMKNVLGEPKKPWTKIGEENRWAATADFTGDKPFGVVKSSEGRGTMMFVRYYDINEDIEGYFPYMKARMLALLSEWMEKGWVTREEAELAMGGTPPRVKPVARRPAMAPVAAPAETLDELKTRLKDLLDEDKKAASLKKLEKALAGLDYDAYTGLEDVEAAIEQYREAEKDEKADAFNDVSEEIDELDLAEE